MSWRSIRLCAGLFGGALLLPAEADAKDLKYRATVDVQKPGAVRDFVCERLRDLGKPCSLHGYVFEDLNRDGRKQPKEPGVRNVPVSNGLEVVLTDRLGRYPLDGELAEASRCYARALALDEALGREAELANTLANAATVAHLQGDSARAAELFGRALALYEKRDSPSPAARVRALLRELGPTSATPGP